MFKMVSTSPLPVHCYILLKDKGKHYNRGELVELEDVGRYVPHTHCRYVPAEDPISADSYEVAPLTVEDCRVLYSILSDNDRYTAYSTPGKLAWGVGLKVGDTVLARLPPKRHASSSGGEKDLYTTAIIRWRGDTEGRYWFGVEITDERYYGCGENSGTFNRLTSFQQRYFTCKNNCGLFLTLADLKQPPSSDGATANDLQECVSQLERQLRDKTQETEQICNSLRVEVATLHGEVDEKEATIAKLQGEIKEKKTTIARLQWRLHGKFQGELKEKEATIARLEGEVREKIILQGEVWDNEAMITRLREEVDKLQGEAREKAKLQGEVEEKEATIGRLQGEVRDNKATITTLWKEVAGLQGEAKEKARLQGEVQEKEASIARLEKEVARLQAIPQQALGLWELPREEVHISQSQTIVGTGGWGYVARGTFLDQPVAVKCLHRDILSPQNEGRVRHEISIMAQVRHPNLLLLIGAVLTVEGEGPLIVMEWLDKSLCSVYEDGLLEDRSKLPVLQDVASALTYLHSHRTPIIHRDVSSANIFLEAIRNECWKAKLGSANLSHLAATPVEGSAVYVAPEVSTKDHSGPTPKIDVYSFGVLACEVCLCQLRRDLPSMLGDVRNVAPNTFLLASNCTSLAHQDRPDMRNVLLRIAKLRQ